MRHDDDDWAVFWCSLLGPMLLEEVPAGERRRFLAELSQKEVLLPSGRRKRISLSTLRRKVRQFGERKIAGLRRQPRQDRGQARKDRQAMLARAVELKKQQPRRSPAAINEFLRKEFGRTIPKSTMNRHLRQARRHAPEAGRDAGEDPLSLDARPQQCAVGGRFFRRSLRVPRGPGR